jgi:hypothetical protein
MRALFLIAVVVVCALMAWIVCTQKPRLLQPAASFGPPFCRIPRPDSRPRPINRRGMRAPRSRRLADQRVSRARRSRSRRMKFSKTRSGQLKIGKQHPAFCEVQNRHNGIAASVRPTPAEAPVMITVRGRMLVMRCRASPVAGTFQRHVRSINGSDTASHWIARDPQSKRCSSGSCSFRFHARCEGRTAARAGEGFPSSSLETRRMSAGRPEVHCNLQTVRLRECERQARRPGSPGGVGDL